MSSKVHPQLKIPKSPVGTKLMKGPVSDDHCTISIISNMKIGPSCRSAVSPDKLFPRHAFEPTEADLNPEAVKPEVKDMDIKPDLFDVFEDALPARTDRKGKGKAKRARRVVDSEDDSEGEADSDLDDFIVQSDEDEDDKNSRLAAKKRLGKKRAIVESDSETDEEEREVIHGQRMRSDSHEDVDVKMLPRFLPSTKMKVSSTR